MVHPEQYFTAAELAEPFSHKRWIYQPENKSAVLAFIPNRYCLQAFIDWREGMYEQFILDCKCCGTFIIADIYAMLQNYDGISFSRD